MFRLCLSCSFVGIHSDFYPPHTDLFDVSPGLLLLLLGSLIPRSHSLCVCRLFRFSKQLSCLQGGLPSGCPATALSNATCYWLLQSFIAKDISWLLFVYAQVVAGYFYRTTEGKQKCLKKKVRTNYIRIHAVRSRFIIIAHCSSNLFLCFLCCDEYPIVDLQCEFFCMLLPINWVFHNDGAYINCTTCPLPQIVFFCFVLKLTVSQTTMTFSSAEAM